MYFIKLYIIIKNNRPKTRLGKTISPLQKKKKKTSGDNNNYLKL